MKERLFKGTRTRFKISSMGPGITEQREGEAGGWDAEDREELSSSFHGNSHPVVGIMHLPLTDACWSQHHLHGL